MGEVLRPRPTSWRSRLDQSALGSIRSYIGEHPHFRGPYRTHMTARHMAGTTIDRYLLAAHQLDAYLTSEGISNDVGRIARGDVEKFLAWGLEKGDAPTTVCGRYNALVQFFAFVALEVKPEPYASPMAGMAPPACEPPKVAIIPDRILVGMLAACEGGRERKTFEQIRDAAIIRLFMNTGARNDEITQLTLEDLLDGDLVRVWGKSKGGGKVERHVPYDDRTGQALRRYLRAREHHPAAGSDRLWLGLKGPMTTSGIRQMIWKRSERAGQRVHPHQFRHTFAHKWKKDPRRKDGDLKYLAGWRTDTMLHRYGRSADAERAQEAYRELGSPMEDL